MMGPSKAVTSHAGAVHKVLNRAGYQYIHPEGVEGMRCGVASIAKAFRAKPGAKQKHPKAL